MTSKTTLDDLVGYSYFADKLHLQLKTIYAYANPNNQQHLPNFPSPVTPKGHRQPLFTREDADRFIRERRAGSPTGKGRVKPTSLTKQQREAATKATEILGREIDLESRSALREAIYDDLQLPVIHAAEKSKLPSVATETLRELAEQTKHPFLEQVLIYRGV